MILADKILKLREQNGWSQDELAEKLNVSRQSISKWEMGQSVPGLDRILQMSEIFGVTTDYLVKDELEDIVAGEYEESYIRKVTVDEMNKFLDYRKSLSKFVSTAVMLCITSPVVLMLLIALKELKMFSTSEAVVAGIGLITLMIFIAIAVGLFIFIGRDDDKYKFLEDDYFECEYGVVGIVKERREQYKKLYLTKMIIGVLSCILSVLPLFVSIIFDEKNEGYIFFSVCILLLIVGFGVKNIVSASVINDGFAMLLQEGDYTLKKKNIRGRTKPLFAVYWVAVTAVYLIYSLITHGWNRSWIIWVGAGLLSVLIYLIAEMVYDKGSK
ncbi:MAG: helix-turn-helix transcriptional regulator [Eubacteriales bacterium]|nr:helix-turn-helix transcriptional regulator [Eubacteriales bacterium]MDY3332708.1 helix-turn-helix transcriptional regulator [Gallibacter sp.]